MFDCAYALAPFYIKQAAIIYYAFRRYITRAFARHRYVVNIAQDFE